MVEGPGRTCLQEVTLRFNYKGVHQGGQGPEADPIRGNGDERGPNTLGERYALGITGDVRKTGGWKGRVPG